MLCALAACTLPLEPSAPTPEPELEIRGTTLLMAGGRGRLSAWQGDSGDVREVNATWRAEGDAVSLTSNGAITGRHPGRAVVRATYRDRTGTATVHVVTSAAGTWRGSITVVDCWRTTDTVPESCEGRIGLTAPLVLEVIHSAAADHYDNLRAVVKVFTPPATGSFFGAVDSSGLFFLEGYVERQADSLGGALKFRWQRETDDRLIPFTLHAQANDRVDVQLSLRIGSTPQTLNEIWQLSAMTR
jgi:hypothetical protein